jgi:hypothetical protein
MSKLRGGAAKVDSSQACGSNEGFIGRVKPSTSAQILSYIRICLQPNRDRHRKHDVQTRFEFAFVSQSPGRTQLRPARRALLN